MREYEVKVTTVTTVYVEEENEEDAIHAAAELYWQMDPDSADYEITEVSA